MVTTDILRTIWESRGIGQLVNSYAQAISAANSYAAAENRVDFAASLQQREMAINSLQLATARYIASAVVGTAIMAIGAARATMAYSEWAKEIMNVRDLTGATARDSARAMALFKVAGVTDIQVMRDLLRISKATFNPQGQAALGMLGISPNVGKSGLALFNEIADALNKSTLPALQKTMLMEQIFGTRGVAALLPLLRLTKSQREETSKLADEYDASLPAMQRFQFQMANLGMTMFIKVISPMAKQLIPVIIKAVNVFGWMARAFGSLNQATGGLAAYAVVLTGIVTSFLLWATAIRKIWGLLYLMLTPLKANVTLMAMASALAGQWKNIAIAAAIGGVAWVGMNLMGGNKRESEMDSAAGDLKDAAENMNDASHVMMDAFKTYNKGGSIPSNLGEMDIISLQRSMALGAIG